MDTLHTVLRSIRGETKSRRDHITVFREFLDHLDRAARRKSSEELAPEKSARAPKGKARRGKR